MASVGPQPGPELIHALGLDAAVVYATWAAAFVVITALFWLTYYLLPHADQSSGKKEVLIGAVVGTVVWALASALFRAYVANFGSYAATYGVLAGGIVLLLWLYITALAILFGGEVAATLQQEARGRTTLQSLTAPVSIRTRAELQRRVLRVPRPVRHRIPSGS